ncbi:MAG: DNA-processing protein DprA, partial [Bacilli bacterium]
LMTAHGLLITEYPNGFMPQRWSFPARNRLISGLCEGLIVIEAKERSGSLISAYQALEQGRDVYVLPARCDDPSYAGNIKLLKEGALPFTSAEDWCNAHFL